MEKTLHFRAIVLLTAIMILPNFSFAQAVTEEWAERYNNNALNGNDFATAIAIDDAGNIYVTGESVGSGTAQDYYTIKYNSNGDFVWGKRYNGPANNTDIPSAMVVDDSQNVYVTGRSWGTSFDYYTIKYGANGESLWEKRYNNDEANGEDRANAIAVDGSGNVYVTGQSVGNGTSWDFYTIAYGPNGNILWTDRYNGTGNSIDVAFAIAVDESGNVYITGSSVGAAGSGYDMLTIKYDSSGDILWTERYNGTANNNDEPYAIAVDESGNVHITGYSVGVGSGADYLTIKYDTDGNELWEKRYSGPNPGSSNVEDTAESIAVDASGNVFVTGRSVQGGTYRYATLKYDANGNTVWSSTYNGPANGNDVGVAVALDVAGDVYVTGTSVNVGLDIATVKYDSETGEELWVERYIPGAQGGGAQNDGAVGMAVDGSGNVYVTGSSDGSGTGVDYVTIKYSQPFFFDCPELDANIGDACDDQDETTDNDLVGVDCECAGTIVTSVETIDDAAFAVFPNPASQAVFLRLGEVPTGPINVRIVNMLGQTVRSFSTPNQSGQQIELNISDIPAGLYLTVISIDNMQGVKRLVIE